MSIWRNRDYLLLWAGQGVSTVGSQASQLALPLLILAVTGSPVRAGLLGGLRGGAYAVAALPAGAVVDRWRRKRLMVACDLGRAAAFGSVPLALASGHLSAAQLYAVALIEGALYAFFGLSEVAALARVVPASSLSDAVAQNQATDAAAGLAGPPLGGALFGLARALPFVVDAASYAVSALSLLMIRTALDPQQPQAERGVRADLVEGARWIRGQAALLSLLWLNGGANFIFGGWPILLIELAQRLGAGSATIGLIFATGGAGTVLGALVAPRIQRRLGVAQLMLGLTWLYALTWAPYALASNLVVLGVVNLVGFFFVPIWSTTQLSYRLLLTPGRLHGRVNSVFWLVTNGAQSLGFLLMGVLLQRYGPVRAVWITFAPAVALALLASTSRQLRQAGRLSETTAESS